MLDWAALEQALVPEREGEEISLSFIYVTQ